MKKYGGSFIFQCFDEYNMPLRKNWFSSELIRLSGNTVLTYAGSLELAAVIQFLPEEKGKPE